MIRQSNLTNLDNYHCCIALKETLLLSFQLAKTGTAHWNVVKQLLQRIAKKGHRLAECMTEDIKALIEAKIKKGGSIYA